MMDFILQIVPVAILALAFAVVNERFNRKISERESETQRHFGALRRRIDSLREHLDNSKEKLAAISDRVRAMEGRS